MVLKKIYFILIITNLLLLSGCRIIDWGKKTFYQGCKNQKFDFIPKAHISSVRVYDEFSTLAIFNGMWLSQEVIQSYVDLYASRNELDQTQKENFLNLELEKFDGLISFYILAYVPQSICPIYMPNKGVEESWKIFLKIGKSIYEPYKIKTVELSPEFKLFFGNYLSKFKTVYLVQFLDTDQNGNCLFDETIRKLTLCFTSLTHRVSISWKVDKNGNLINSNIRGNCICPIENQNNCEICC